MFRHNACLLVVCCAVCGPAMAQDFTTPEAAFREHQAAWARRNIDDFLSTISFQQEAVETLQKRSPNASVLQGDINALASEREAQLREMLRTRGFKPDYLPTCKILNKWPLSGSTVRIAVGCEKGAMAYSMRLVRSVDGWRVVRGP